ncbi:tautomerase PptA [Photorhabdus antumapuensis]|uniref:tautomerase PptA n=1 Tax=Photorhabdus antumapuensis TaxID=2862867 RepID=UPI001CEE0695|nr:tautomerase PptA [Photorhabdus antumapuensis]MCA6220998.1 tautomerase PptA [Photorhabdus antumapuensis]
MPHISIKHFPAHLSREDKDILSLELTKVITKMFGCREDVISISLEPIEKEKWNEEVYFPEIKLKETLLIKLPNY